MTDDPLQDAQRIVGRLGKVAQRPDGDLFLEPHPWLPRRLVTWLVKARFRAAGRYSTSRWPEGLRWTCHVCNADRPDAFISVATAEFQIRGAAGQVNRRYCNDQPECAQLARALADIEAKRLGDR